MTAINLKRRYIKEEVVVDGDYGDYYYRPHCSDLKRGYYYQVHSRDRQGTITPSTTGHTFSY